MSILVPHNLQPFPQEYYRVDGEREGLVARLDVARLGAVRLGFLGWQPPDDGMNTGFAEWQDGSDFPLDPEEWVEGGDFK